MNIHWYEQIQALEALIHTYEMLNTFHRGNYALTDEDQVDIARWRGLIWAKTNELTKELEK